jgi:hypothetical protein
VAAEVVEGGNPQMLFSGKMVEGTENTNKLKVFLYNGIGNIFSKTLKKGLQFLVNPFFVVL